jgi:hypothetical protein
LTARPPLDAEITPGNVIVPLFTIVNSPLPKVTVELPDPAPWVKLPIVQLKEVPLFTKESTDPGYKTTFEAVEKAELAPAINVPLPPEEFPTDVIPE